MKFTPTQSFCKFLISFILLFLSTSHQTNAQTITYSGTNVGIGSSSPGQTLDVQGTVRATGFTLTTGASSGYVLTSSGVGVGTWQPAGGGVSGQWITVGGSGNVGISTTGTVGIGTTQGSASLTIMNGNVGIGTWNPTQLFQVNGVINLMGTNCVQWGNDNLAGICGSSSTSANLNFNTNTSLALANGGTMTISGNNEIHTFLTSGTFTPNFNGIITVLVVAGGGGAANQGGGGGGGGGVIYNSSYSVTNGTPITVTVGAGGTFAEYGGSGSQGGNSIFGTLTAIGGGYGANSGNTGGSGGSGGGGGSSSSTILSGGSGTSDQGNAGGNNGGYYTGAQPSGGGGGCGAVGGNATSASVSGNGGVGCQYSISGTSVYYAGGGGGCSYGNGATCGSAGSGGGATACSSGTANTGGGGGGCTFSYPAGAGGSGIVIVSINKSIYSSSGLTATVTTGGNVGIGSSSPNGVFDTEGTVGPAVFFGIATSTQNVGIGSFYPGQKLDIQGTIRSLGFIETGTAANVFSGNVGIGTILPVGGLTIGSNNHLGVTGTTQPSLSSCGTSPSITGNDFAFTITGGTSSTGCTATFGTAFNTAPTCVVTPESGSVTNTFSYTVSNTAVTITQSGFGTNKADVVCIGHD